MSVNAQNHVLVSSDFGPRQLNGSCMAIIQIGVAQLRIPLRRFQLNFAQEHVATYRALLHNGSKVCYPRLSCPSVYNSVIDTASAEQSNRTQFMRMTGPIFSEFQATGFCGTD